jgi:hypothetical protein
MTTIQKTFEKQLEDISHQLLKELLEKKIRELGLNLKPNILDQFVTHLINKNNEPFNWDDGKDTDSAITLDFSEAEMAELEEKFLRLHDSIPQIIESSSTYISKDLLETLKRNWKKENSLQKKELDVFRKNLEKRWGKALGLLRMLLTISREFASEITKLKSQNKSQLDNVLLRLHIRACQVTAEIITLLENGYSDGAMARWRTLHEISIVMLLIHDHGEPLAERYIAHRAVEARSGKNQYELCYKQLGYRSLNAKTKSKIDQEYDNAIKQYGKEFGEAYGWAYGFVKEKSQGRIGLAELESAANLSVMGSHYKLASYNIHAGPHALFFRLGQLDTSAFLAGASNAGLSEPGQNTAITFSLISTLLAKDCEDLDTVVTLKMLILIRDEIPGAFAKAELKLQIDHARNSKRKKNNS